MEFEKLQKTLGVAIRRYRAKLGLSQEAFADKVGLHRTYVGGIERGERNVSLANLHQIARGLNLPLSELFAEAEKTDNNNSGI